MVLSAATKNLRNNDIVLSSLITKSTVLPVISSVKHYQA